MAVKITAQNLAVYGCADNVSLTIGPVGQARHLIPVVMHIPIVINPVDNWILRIGPLNDPFAYACLCPLNSPPDTVRYCLPVCPHVVPALVGQDVWGQGLFIDGVKAGIEQDFFVFLHFGSICSWITRSANIV